MKFVAFILALLLTLANAQNFSTDWYDNNPSADEFEISTAADLRGLAELVNRITSVRFAGKTIKLANNIDLGGENFTPIGKSTTNNFLGTFDGQGHTISGLSVTVNAGSSAGYAGLFGYVGATNANSDVQIKNVNIIASKIEITTSSSVKIYAGGLVGYFVGTNPIENCSVKADTIIAFNSLDAYAGGLAGYTEGTPVNNSHASGNIVASAFSGRSYAGGLIGYASDGVYTITFSDCRTSGNVSAPRGSETYAGGLIGYLDNRGTAAYTTTFTNCYASGDISTSSGTSYSGGLIGRANQAIKITNSYASGNVTASLRAGVAAFNYYSGGLVGYLTGGYVYGGSFEITKSYASGVISVDNAGSGGTYYCGGLVGYIGNSTPIEITDSYSSGPVLVNKTELSSGTYYSGGLIGYTNSSTSPNNTLMKITNSYAGGNVFSLAPGSSGTVYAGGIFGRYYYIEGQQTFTSIYYNSDATANAAGTVCNSATNCDTSPVPGIAGKSGENMKKQATFTNWNFADIWGIVEDYSTPFLKTELNDLGYWIPSQTYDYEGSQIKPEPKVWSKSKGGTILNKGTDYALSYGDNKNAGKGTITITGIGEYQGSSSIVTFNINPKELTVSGANAEPKTYDGTTAATITGAALEGICNSDDVYLINHLEGVFASADAGNGIPVALQMSLSGDAVDNYTLKQPELTGNIMPKQLAEDAIQSIPAQTYNGLAITPAIIVTDGLENLVKDVDYTVSYLNNTEAGNASVKATGINNYTGEATIDFEISSDPLPIETFEYGTNGWVFVNASTNRWIIGTDAKFNGSHSAYISNNNSANSYTVTSSSTVHLYKDIAFPESESDFVLTFYFKGMGERTYDYMTVKYSLNSASVSAGSIFSGTRLDSCFSMVNWTRRAITLPASIFSGKTIRLVFTWRNDSSGGTQPPAAIDDINISIIKDAVSTPTLAGKTHNSITINAVAPLENGQVAEYAISSVNSPPNAWVTALTYENLEPNTDYYIFARAKENENYLAGPVSVALVVKTNVAPNAIVPFIETFEHGSNGWVAVNGANAWIINSNTRYNGSYSAYISGNGSTNSYDIKSGATSHFYRDVVFPVSNIDFILSFYFRGEGYASLTDEDYMTVGYYSSTSSTPTRDNAFNGTVLGEHYLKNSSWANKTITLPASTFSNKTIRLVFTWRNVGYYANEGNYLPAAIDDISIYVSGSSVPSSSSGSSSSSSDGTTPIRLPQIASSNQATQIHNGINLQVTRSAVVEIYGLDGKLIGKQNFGGGVYNVSLGYLPKGLYIVNTSFGSEKKVLKVPIR